MTLLNRFVALLLIAFFCGGILVGSLFMQMSAHHASGATQQLCPIAGTSPACANAFEHVTHWQTALTGTVAQMLALFVLAIVFAGSCRRLPLLTSAGPPRASSGGNTPTLLQQLFSQGILHPKAP